MKKYRAYGSKPGFLFRYIKIFAGTLHNPANVERKSVTDRQKIHRLTHDRTPCFTRTTMLIMEVTRAKQVSIVANTIVR